MILHMTLPAYHCNVILHTMSVRTLNTPHDKSEIKEKKFIGTLSVISIL